MGKHVLNEMYPFSSGFGTKHQKTIIELTKEYFPNLDTETQRNISIYIEKTRREINDYFFRKYDYKNDNANTSLQKNGLNKSTLALNEDNILSSG